MAREDTSFGGRQRGCRFVLALGALLAAAAPAGAQAPEDGRVVQWSAPLECPPEVEVVEEIERLLGRALDPTGVSVRGSVERDEGGFALALTLRQGEVESHRGLSDPSCESLTRAGALVIALAIDPTVLASLEEEEEEPYGPGPDGDAVVVDSADLDPIEADPVDGDRVEADRVEPDVEAQAAVETPVDAGMAVRAGRPTELPAEPDPTRDAEPEGGDDASRTPGGPAPAPRFVGQLFGALSLGPLPSATPGGGLAAGVGYDALELVLGAYGVAPQEGNLSNAASGGTVGLVGGRVRGCASFEAADALLEVLPCALFEVGVTWATGVRVPVVRTGFAPWVAVGAGARLRVWLLDALGLEAFAELQVPLLRAPFVLTLAGERREFHRASEVGALFGLGVAVRLR